MRLISMKSFATFAAIATALTISACGNKQKVVHEAETEGIGVNVAELRYQVQISRQLNPEAIPEDRTFVSGIEGADAELGADEVWFAVFVRVENESDDPQAPTDDITIHDTDGNVYEPIEIGAENPFFYDTAPIGAGRVAPDVDAIAGQIGSINGMLLLYKIKHESLDNRPLELEIKSQEPEDESTVTLDV